VRAGLDPLPQLRSSSHPRRCSSSRTRRRSLCGPQAEPSGPDERADPCRAVRPGTGRRVLFLLPGDYREILHAGARAGSSVIPRTALRGLTIRTSGVTMLNHTVRPGIHQALVAVLGSHPVWGRTVHAQHLDDLDNSIMLPDDPAVHQKMVTDASVHERPPSLAGYPACWQRPQDRSGLRSDISTRPESSASLDPQGARIGTLAECWDAPSTHVRFNPRDRWWECAIRLRPLPAAARQKASPSSALGLPTRRRPPRAYLPPEGLARGPWRRGHRVRAAFDRPAPFRPLRPTIPPTAKRRESRDTGHDQRFCFVETKGLEPSTPAVQRRCSAKLSYVPGSQRVTAP
jgi:hypothetical protein